jgi:hypothetical protein
MPEVYQPFLSCPEAVVLTVTPIPITGAVTIKAIAVKSGMTNSGVLSAAYTIDTSLVATPTASPGSGVVASGTMITLSTTTDGATIYYTTNGSTPTTSSTPYSAPIPVTTAVTIKAIAVKDGMTNSGVLSVAYWMTPGTVMVIYAWADELDEIATSASTATLSRGGVNNSLTITVSDSWWYYQWTYNGSDIAGETGSSYIFTSAGKSNGTYYIGFRARSFNYVWYSTQITITVTD